MINNKCAFVIIALFVGCALLPLDHVAQATTPTTECNKQKPSIEEAFNEASLIFIGRVKQKYNNPPLRKGFSEITFDVQNGIKGTDELPTLTAIIYTPADDSQCPYEFYIGSDYLVYATGTIAFYKTNSLTRTTNIETALKANEISALRKLAITENARAKE